MLEPIGILTAMPDEMRSLLARLEADDRVEHGRRLFAGGRLFGHQTVLVESRIGKVAAAAAATELIVRFNVRTLLFTGLAGGLDPRVRIGDIVVADSLAQHDLDASPLFPPMEIPLLGRDRLPTDAAISDRLARAAADYLATRRADGGGPEGGAVHRGLIVSGDRFVSSTAEAAALRRRVPEALCVEMEGAAVAQVAYEYGVPLGLVRTVSDAADDAAAAAFPEALAVMAAHASAGVLERALG